MRIVISGTHAAGKSTLAAALAARLPGYEVVEEPYDTLVAEGHAFAAVPGADDFELLIERSVASLTEHASPTTLFDRGPVDYLAYLAVVSGDPPGAIAEWLPRVRDAMRRVDLVVFVPIEGPDRVRAGASEARRLRKAVQAMLHEMLIEDAWGLGVPVLEVAGTPDERASQVLARLSGGPQPVRSM